MRKKLTLRHSALLAFTAIAAFAQPSVAQIRIDGPIEEINIKTNPIKKFINFDFEDPQGVNPCCAPWAESKIPLSLQPIFQSTASGPFTLNYSAAPGVNNQMQAFLDYVSKVCSSCTQVKITWQIADLGSGATPAMIGPPAAPAANVIWNAGGGGITSGGPFWSGFPFQPNIWYGIKTTVSHNGQTNCPLFPALCTNDKWAFKWNSVPMKVGASSPSQETVLEVVDARGRLTRSAPLKIEAGRPLNMPATAANWN